ncbi:uncharacterized protein [Ptychodera flava]|uniref:uncharacterized protein n=1 Tax=Ptychodera flava TaxID=63121 RepID=UPI00396A5198
MDDTAERRCKRRRHRQRCTVYLAVHIFADIVVLLGGGLLFFQQSIATILFGAGFLIIGVFLSLVTVRKLSLLSNGGGSNTPRMTKTLNIKVVYRKEGDRVEVTFCSETVTSNSEEKEFELGLGLRRNASLSYGSLSTDSSYSSSSSY